MTRMLAAFCSMLAAISNPALAALSGVADGWGELNVSRAAGANSPRTCTVNGPTDGPAVLTVAAIGPQFMLLISSDDLAQSRASYSVNLSIDHDQDVQMNALGSDRLVGIAIGGALARRVVQGRRLTVTTQGHTYVFEPRNMLSVLDAVARCADVPTLAEMEAHAPQPIIGAGDWRIVDGLPGVKQHKCSARLNGSQIDTSLILNDRGDVVLMAARADWAAVGGAVEATLSVDGGQASPIKANMINNLAITVISDPALLENLRAARTVDWTLPNGRFHADVSGLGAALDAIRACDHAPASGG